MTTTNFKNLWSLLSICLIAGVMMTITSCDKDPDEIVDEFGINITDLYGKWSITAENDVVTDAAGTIVSEETNQYTTNFETIEFKENQSFLYISVEDAEWETGDITVDDVTNSVNLDFDVEITTIHIVSMTATTAEFEIIQEEEENGQIYTITSTITASKNTGSEPGIDATDLKTKWSMGNNDIYINDVKITADILEEQWMESVATINDNMYTFEFGSDNSALSVDNYMTGSFAEGELQILDRSNFVVELEGYEDPFLFHIKANTGTGDMLVVHYPQMEQVTARIEQDWQSTFDEVTIDATLFAGDWEVTAKTEGKEINGTTATPDGEGPEIGNVLTFYSNGSGLFGNDQFTFEFIDDSNMALISAGETEYTLIHFETFNGTDEVSIWNMNSDWNDGSFEQQWLRLDLVKQD